MQANMKMVARGVLAALAMVATSFPVVAQAPAFDFTGYKYATYLGSAANDFGEGVEFAPDGGLYVLGYSATGGTTPLTGFPSPGRVVTMGPGGGLHDLFLAKINSAGTALEFVVIIGGSASEDPGGLAVGPDGTLYVSGSTASANFPTLNGAQPASAGGQEAFLFAIDPASLSLKFSTYLGGHADDFGGDVSVGPSGDPFVVGRAFSGDFPARVGEPSSEDAWRQFVARFDATGELAYVRADLMTYDYYGGMNGIGVDSEGNAYVTDRLRARKLSPDGREVLYEIAWGNDQVGRAINIGADGAAYVVSTGNDNDSVDPGITVRKILPDGSAFAYETELPVSLTRSIGIGGIAVDAAGFAYVAYSLWGGTENWIGSLVRVDREGRLVYTTSPASGLGGVAVRSNGTVAITGYARTVGHPTLRPVQAQQRALDAYVALLKFKAKVKAQPSISGVEKRVKADGSTTQTVITGANFQPGARVFIKDSKIPDESFVVKSPTKIVRQNHVLPDAGETRVTVVNFDGGEATFTYRP
jgi:hypothetical protein